MEDSKRCQKDEWAADGMDGMRFGLKKQKQKNKNKKQNTITNEKSQKWMEEA